MMQEFDYDWERLAGLGFDLDYVEKATGELKQSCWKGYTAVGTKKKGGKTVPNCVPVKPKKSEHKEGCLTDSECEGLDHKEGDVATAEMTPNYLPKEPIPGGGDLKNPEMGEQKIRMPRMEELKKVNAKDGHLAMHATVNDSNYSELKSGEPNGAMALNQLRVMQEKIAILLSMVDPDDNLEPWMATKLTMSAQNLSSVADYARFGVEFSEEQ